MRNSFGAALRLRKSGGEGVLRGERQHIGIARAFLHDAPLMLLDEPTSNLDSLNEGIILKSIMAERACKTVVLVSHHASTMGIADTVYEMNAPRSVLFGEQAPS